MYRNPRRSHITVLLFILTLFLSGEISAQAQNSVSASQPRSAISVLDSTKEKDGLAGPVRRVRIESAKIGVQEGHPIELPRQLLELTTYGIRGNRVENTSYPNGDSLIGKEEYKHDQEGNIIEMTLRDDHNAILSREVYSYEFDSFGNWTKLVASLVVIENGQLKREPVEVTYRTVTYYFNDSVVKIVNVSSPQKMSAATEPTEIQWAGLKKTKVDLSFGSGNASATSVKPADAPVALTTKPPAEVTAFASRIGKDETNAASQAAGSELISVRLINGPSATNASGPMPNAGEVTESKLNENVPVPLIAPNSSAVEASRTEGSPVNLKPAEAAAAQKTALDYFQTGVAQFDAGDVKSAVEAYLESIKLEPGSAEVFLSLGSAYLTLDKNSAATKAFKQAVKLNPNLAEAQYGLGLASFRLKRLTDAMAGFKKATILDPKMAKAHFGLGLAYQELRETNSVMQEYRILQSLDKDLAKQLAKTFPAYSDLPINKIIKE